MKAAYIFWMILYLKWIQKHIVDLLLDLFLNVSTLYGSRLAQKERHQYKFSAQKVKIWARGSYSSASVHGLRNFLYTHMQNCHPNVVLQADNITLQVNTILNVQIFNV